jgi:integrase
MTSLAESLKAVREGTGLEYFRSYFRSEFPVTMEALRLVDTSRTCPPKRKGFNLVKRENRKKGFVYYVRYSHQGKMLPSKWNTGTNVTEEAEKFAAENRERLVGRYLREHDAGAFRVFGEFFGEGSVYLAREERRNRPLSETTRKSYHSVINTKFIPFLRERKIGGVEGISAGTLCDFQDHCLARGMRPQTVNDYLKAVKRVFLYLARKGMVKGNPCAEVKSIPVRAEDRTARGCHEIEKLKGVFNRKWGDQKQYLLCLLIHTTGMRNGEIRRIRMADIKLINGCRFIDIRESKTESGVRLVPLHEKVYREMEEYGRGKSPDEAVFGACPSVTFSKACRELARRVSGSEGGVEDKSITFYSGRHYWKTLMNSGGLGEEAEEIFMGHKVSGDMAKLYNHRDKQGRKMIARKAKQVFSILDRRLFAAPGRGKE